MSVKNNLWTLTYSLKDGFRNAVYLSSEKDFTRNNAYDCYFVYPAIYAGKKQFVFCRVMKTNNKTRLYIHEVFNENDIINKTDDTFKTGSISKKETTQHGGIALYKSILQKYVNVNKENISKVVDENGEPLVVYHALCQ